MEGIWIARASNSQLTAARRARELVRRAGRRWIRPARAVL